MSNLLFVLRRREKGVDNEVSFLMDSLVHLYIEIQMISCI